MQMFISFTALLLSVVLLQLSSGGVGPLDALSGLQHNFTKAEVGLLGSAHYIGFFIGCWWAPRALGTVGHSRAFAAFTSTGAIGLIGHTLVADPYAWAVMRIASGLCIAGCYTIIEAWLNSEVTNETRGRAMGSYRVVDMGASLFAQLIIGVLEPGHYISYNLLALLCCASLLPLALTKRKQPLVPSAPRLRPMLAVRISPLATAGVLVAGLTASAFRMVGPIYGQELGLNINQIAFFLATFVLGGALAQYPAGWLADRYDRRWVLINLSVAAILSCTITVLIANSGTLMIMIAAGLFGFTTFPIFSVSTAHAHDFAKPTERVELSAALMFLFAIGAIASPIVSSILIELYGPQALFVFLALGHAVLIIFGLSRMLVRDTREGRTAYVYTPRSSFTIGRLLRRQREKK